MQNACHIRQRFWQPTAIVCLVGAALLEAQPARPIEYADAAEGLADLRDPRINEASGIAASRRNPGLYYVHNDSGDESRVFVVDRTGRTRAVLRLKDTRAADWEDIAMAPGSRAGTWDICVADIGDNGAHRPNVTLYRFPEPEIKDGPEALIEITPTAYTLRCADGPVNAEALAVHPRTGDAYILTKRTDGHSAVYKLAAPWDSQKETVLPRLLMLELPPGTPLQRIVTAADIRPDGQRVAVRCYLGGWEWRLPAGTPDREFDRIFEARPNELSLAAEPQGEGLCYAADGQAILTISEGRSPTLYELRVLAPTSRPGK